jgi:hypothetical protein
MTPVITDAEKIKRRNKVKANRRLRCKKSKPLSPRRKMIRYPEFRERGWQIGSGPTPSPMQALHETA